MFFLYTWGQQRPFKINPTMTVCINDALICCGTFLLSQSDVIKIRLVLSAKPALYPQNNHCKITEKTTGKQPIMTIYGRS